MNTPARTLRLFSFLLALAALPACCQEAPAPSAQPVGSGIPTPAASQPERPVLAGAPIHAPVLLHAVDPVYSDQARREGFSGEVRVGLLLDKDGKPTHLMITNPIGHGLDEQAILAVRQYKFKPATQNGQPIAVAMSIYVKFQISVSKH